eukprot:3147739-Pleurochrysis_carterae.AAC.1
MLIRNCVAPYQHGAISPLVKGAQSGAPKEALWRIGAAELRGACLLRHTQCPNLHVCIIVHAQPQVTNSD